MLSYLGVRLSTFADNLIGILLMAVASTAAVVVRVKLRDFFFPLAVAWAVTAIAIKQSGNTAIVVSAAVAVIICVVTSGSVVIELKDSSSD
jgi:hypothetical protein